MYIEAVPWKGSTYSRENNLHTVCSYMAMFPPPLPNYFIQKYSSPGEVILDPFSGRGTTVLEACKLNRFGIGNDLNPLAFLLTKAKTNVPEKKRVVARIHSLEKKFTSDINLSTVDGEIRMLFSDLTLSQIVFLKKQLNWKTSSVDAFISSLLLGIMHGGSEGYLSLSMPNTFSMSPNYIRKFVAEHHLEKPERNVFELLLRKLERSYEKPPLKGKAYNQDARNMSRLKDKSVDLIVTSPPYTRVIRYGAFNWIRLWFLDKGPKQIDRKLFFTESVPKYISFMMDVFKEFNRVLKDKGIAVVVIGDVKHRGKESFDNLAHIVLDKCAEPAGFTLKEAVMQDSISSESKVSKIWGKTRGRATECDRVLVLQKQ
jgi:site-specific DNA-methyltransferase (adenine-specific)